MRLRFILILVALAMLGLFLPVLGEGAVAFANAAPPKAVAHKVARVAIVVGANDGGKGRVKLRHASSDADRLAKTLRELAGVDSENLQILRDSSIDSLEAGLRELEVRLERAKEVGTRVELIFYYSGHSDETGLLLTGKRYDYARLRDRISKMPADVKIAILDSCASGAFTRSKGGRHKPAFLIDESSQVAGYAFIASSSESELAQESDRIASSFFTHYFVSGLRGGADTNRDGRVTLSEAYQFAFDETVANTEGSQHGAQHPAYNMHLAGTGDVVVTDLRATSRRLIVDRDLLGRLFIRDSRGDLVIEIGKSHRHPLTLGLAPDRYTVVLAQGEKRYRSDIDLRTTRELRLAAANFAAFEGEATVARGDLPASESEVEVEIFGASLLPSLSFSGPSVRRHVSLNLLGGKIAELEGAEVSAGFNIATRSMRGVQLAALGSVVQGEVTGLQLSGVANYGGGPVSGFQIAGVANLSRGEAQAAQIGGVFNANDGRFVGAQVGGVFNINADPFDGVQIAGVSNLVHPGRMRGIQIAGVSNYAEDTTGLQLAGTFNYGGDLRGLQVSGVGNVAKDVTGGQIGVVNVAAGKVEGLQLGVVNVAEESDASIGILNLIRHGYKGIEGWSSTAIPMQLGVKTGSRYTYSMLAVGYDSEYFRSGGGFGLHLAKGEVGGSKLFVDLDGLVYGLMTLKSPGDGDPEDMLVQARLLGGGEVGRVRLFAGASFDQSFTFDGRDGPAAGDLPSRLHRSGSLSLRQSLGLFAGAALVLGH